MVPSPAAGANDRVFTTICRRLHRSRALVLQAPPTVLASMDTPGDALRCRVTVMKRLWLLFAQAVTLLAAGFAFMAWVTPDASPSPSPSPLQSVSQVPAPAAASP